MYIGEQDDVVFEYTNSRKRDGSESFLAIDNNASERQIKQFVIGRKNWMFAGREAGAENAALLFSLVVSCKLAGVGPFAYFRDVLLRIHSHPAKRIAELIPRAWQTRFAPAAFTRAHSAA